MLKNFFTVEDSVVPTVTDPNKRLLRDEVFFCKRCPLNDFRRKNLFVAVFLYLFKADRLVLHFFITHRIVHKII